MPHPPYRTITGPVTHIFGHRFVLATRHGDVLADLTPKGIEQIVLRAIGIEGRTADMRRRHGHDRSQGEATPR